MKFSEALRNAVVATGSLRATINSCFLVFFAGPEPDLAETALDMVATHTQLARLTVNNDGTTPLTFEAAATHGVLTKTAAEVWKGLVAFDGAHAGETTLTPMFFRLVLAGDDGRAAGTAQVRIQGSIGTDITSDLVLLSASLTANGTNTTTLDLFQVQVG